MADALNMRPFGFNVMPKAPKDGQQSSSSAMGESVEKAIGSLWEPVLSYLKDNENVFSGSVLEEIGKANIQTMRLGTIMNEGQEIRMLDTKF